LAGCLLSVPPPTILSACPSCWRQDDSVQSRLDRPAQAASGRRTSQELPPTNPSARQTKKKSQFGSGSSAAC
jgi:hypothetical protein